MTFFGKQILKGEMFDVGSPNPETGHPRLFYNHPHGEVWIGDATARLRTVDSGSVDLVFADPPYNIKKTGGETFRFQEHYIEWSMQWMQEAAQILKPAGTLYVCGFPEIIAETGSGVRECRRPHC